MTPPKLTLAVITGNSERYIARFLECFTPIADEVVIVRAIGGQEHDDTLRRAVKFSKNTDIPFHFIDYKNAPTHEAWPHVDNFAAARNLAFSCAKHDWIFWADTDDIITPDSVALIRSAFEKHHENFHGFAIEYHVPEDGLKVQKERLVNRTKGTWRHAIHEEFKFHSESPPLIRVNEALVTHAPSGSRKTNDERNLRILQSMPPESLTLGHRFHLAQTLRTLEKTTASTATAVELLKEKDLGDNERYELLMNLGETCPDRAQQGNIYLQAYGTHPGRREALGELAIWSIITGRAAHAIHFAAAMMALDRPREYLWNAREMYYGWFGIKIYAMALRLNGQRAKADAIQHNHFHRHGAKISLLHATRGRPSRAFKAPHEWLSRAANPDSVEHIYALDADDQPSLPLALSRAVVLAPGGGCVAAWNAAADASTGQVLVQMSDDFTPPLHWDQIILERIGDLSTPSVLAVSDGFRTDQLLCMAILTRERYRQQGYLFHPDFHDAAMYSDNFFTDRAYADGAVIEARDVVFEHAHPAAGKADMDATYAAQNAPEKYTAGKAIYERLTAPVSRTCWIDSDRTTP
jgi:glycosyltransferase involved in cell wall biosynthesis